MKHPQASCEKRRLKNGHVVHTCKICKDRFETATFEYGVVLLCEGGGKFDVYSQWLLVDIPGPCPVSRTVGKGVTYIPADPRKWADAYRLIFPDNHFYPNDRKPLSFATRKAATFFAESNPKHKLTVAPLRVAA